ncbi:hypothetical protein CPB84DRAFT_1747666 [Gymnopilus junonius]|uniref:Uncharacterized protein n=1 Tax=Gymnopilus junonius TaxID=109634 RepID=A0A9P5NPY6_GYMJU|nr:hypothetical protein CPB84DRAFT_1747666 [Gymnopilus junonius]
MSVVSTKVFEKTSKQQAARPSDTYPAWNCRRPICFVDSVMPQNLSENQGHLNGSIKHALASLATRPVDLPSLHHFQQPLADLLRDRYRRLQQESDLQLSTMLQKSALAAIPSTHAHITWHRGGLRTTYHLRYLHTGNLTYLEETISLALLAVSELALSSSDLPFWQECLAGSYHLRFARLVKAEDLEVEMEWSYAAVESTRAGDPNLPSSHVKNAHDNPDYFTSQQNLAGLYAGRFQLLGNVEDIQKAIIQAVSRHPSALAMSYHNLAFYYKSRHTRLGSFEDLDLAIEYSLKAASSGSPSSSPNFGFISGHCVTLFLERYQSQGKLEDLEIVVKWSEISVVALKDMPGKAANHQYDYTGSLYAI